MVLVIGAGLMARSFLELRNVDTGFAPERVLTVNVNLNPPADGDLAEGAGNLVQRREEIRERLRALPGVVDVGSINEFPLRHEGGPKVEFHRADGTGVSDGSPLQADLRYVSPDYFRAMGIPLLRGEPLPVHRRADERDLWRRASGTPEPILVSETTARRYWPGEDPVGQRVNFIGFTEATIIGIVGDVRRHELAEEPTPAVYFRQVIAPRSFVTFAVRAEGDSRTLAGPIRQIVHEVGPNQSIRSIATLGDVISDSIARDRFFTVLFAVFGGLALVLAAVGIYGVLAYTVSQRTQEIGLRMALGARPTDVLRLTVGKGMLPVGVGLALGTGAALLLSRVLESQLYGISTTDPTVIVAALGFFATIALLASYLPARRASRVDPMVALRTE